MTARQSATVVLEFVDAPPPALRELEAPAERPAAKKRRARRRLPPREVAPDSHRPHGSYVKYTVERCGCQPCRDAKRNYERRRQHAIHRPDEAWVPYVPVGPVRRHLLDLQAAGVGHKTVADLAGLSPSAVGKILYPSRYRGMGTSKRVRAETARRILAVTVDQAAGAQKIDAAPTWRLLDELITKGWPKARLAELLGQRGPGLQISRSRVRASTARKVEQLYQQIKDQPAPGKRSRWHR